MKALITVLALFCIAGCGFIALQLRHTATAALLPGQTLILENGERIDLEISAEYPVTIAGQDCRTERTAEERVQCGPGPVTVTDTRPRLLIWSRANHVRYTVQRHLLN